MIRGLVYRPFVSLVAGKAAIFGNFAWVMGLRVVQNLSALAGIYFLARGLAVGTFGIYSVLMSFLAICAIATLPGLNGAVAQCTARGETGIYWRAVGLALVGSLAGSLICLGGWINFGSTEPALSLALLLAAVLFPASYGILQWKAVLSGNQRFAAVFWLGSLSAILINGSIIVGIHAFPDEILVPIVPVLAVPAVINVLMTLNILRFTRGGEVDAGAISYGLKTSAYLAINTTANHLDKLLLFFLLSAEAAAVFAVAERLAELVKSAVQDLAAVLAPRFAQLPEYTRRLDRQLRLVSTIITIGVLVLTFTILPWAMVVLFSDKYAEAVPFAQGLMVSVAIGAHATIRFRYVLSKLDAVGARDVYTTMSLIRIAGTALLVPFFGLWGAVGSAILYRLVSNVMVHMTIIHRHLSDN